MLALLVPLKGVDVFLRAAARLAPDHPDWRFVVFGDGPEAQRLGALRAELGLDGAVTMPGFVPSAQALAQLRVLVIASYAENAPMALLEAMAAGVAVVTTTVGGIPEIADERVAQLVAPGDPEAIASAVARLMADDALRSAQVRAARERVEQRFTAARQCEGDLSDLRAGAGARGRQGHRMRILLTSPSMDIGGAERVVAMLVAGLAERGHEVALAAPPGLRDGDLVDVAHIRINVDDHGRALAGAAATTHQLARAVRRLRPDVVHAQNVKATAPGAAGGPGRRAVAPARLVHLPWPAASRVPARCADPAPRGACGVRLCGHPRAPRGRGRPGRPDERHPQRCRACHRAVGSATGGAGRRAGPAGRRAGRGDRGTAGAQPRPTGASCKPRARSPTPSRMRGC